MLRRVIPAVLLLAGPALAGGCLAAVARADDVPAQFSTSANPFGSWRYGWTSGAPGTFTSFSLSMPLPQGPVQWAGPHGVAIGSWCGGDVYPPALTIKHGVHLRVGSAGEKPVLRWTAPQAGTYRINVFADAFGGQPVSAPTFKNWDATQSGSHFGNSIAGVGDVNGDGYDDAVFGEPDWDNGQTNEGRILVRFGGPSGLPTNASQTFESNFAGGRLGYSVAGVGDVNGDGYDDVAAGMPGYDLVLPTRLDAGRVQLYYGSASGLTLAAAWPGFGSQAGAQLGFAVAGAGDVNADGYDDILVGEPYWTNGHSAEGRARLYYGTSTVPSSTPAWTVESNQINAHMGWALAGVGDENGDGRADVVVATPDWAQGVATQAGRVEFFLGNTGTGLSQIANWTVIGGQAMSQLGFSVAALGDCNGDGNPDLVVGQPGFDGAVSGTTDIGQALVFLGTGTVSGFAGAPANIIVGESGGSQRGWAVAGAGDRDLDGYADLVVGSPGWDSQLGVDGGSAYGYYGGPSGITTSWFFSSAGAAGSRLGGAVAGGDDFNGDGRADVLSSGAQNFGQVRALQGYGDGPRTVASVELWSGGTLRASAVLDQPANADSAWLSAVVTVTAGQTVDLLLIDTDGDRNADAAAVDVTVLPTPDPVAGNAPAFTLAGRRFVATKSGAAFDGVAFDPVHRRYASNGKVRDECGAELSEGPTGSGIAWDPVTLSYWAIAFDGGTQVWRLDRYDANGTFITTALSIPRIYTKPDATPDTLESLSGIALDSTYVYLVDAGPLNLQPPANAWMKFTRTGVPISVREYGACPFNATQDVVDDIVYSPFSSPTASGRFLAAIEHVGIQVIDAAGDLVDHLSWTEQGIDSRDRPSAFAGLGLDATTGDLLLADNDTGVMLRWNRVPTDGAASLVYAGGSNTPGLALPRGGCTQPLWKNISQTTSCDNAGLYFGLAYRAATRRLYAIDYQSGELWRFDPRSGRGDRVGATTIANVWGIAGDGVHDLLYALEQLGPPGGSQIVRIDPNTAQPVKLGSPVGYSGSDLAYCPSDDKLYTVDRGLVPPRLIRIDRTTGAGSIAGPTANVAGLDWDPTLAKLVGLGSASDTVFAIDPASGAATFAGRSGFGGWEGLAVAPLEPAPTLAAPLPGAATSIAWARLAGNPFRGPLRVRLALAEATDVVLEVYDVAGRRVFRDAQARLSAGEHELAWDAGAAAARPGVYFARIRAGTQQRTLTAVRVE